MQARQSEIKQVVENKADMELAEVDARVDSVRDASEAAVATDNKCPVDIALRAQVPSKLIGLITIVLPLQFVDGNVPPQAQTLQRLHQCRATRVPLTGVHDAATAIVIRIQPIATREAYRALADVVSTGIQVVS